MRVTTTQATNLVPLLNWARKYHRFNKYPCDALRRFSIGFYQIYQAMEWRSVPEAPAGVVGHNRNESLASAALHFLICMEAAGLAAENKLPRDLMELQTLPFHATPLLYCLSRAQQMLIYYTQSNGLPGLKKTVRASRYKSTQLETDLAAAVKLLFQSIPSHQRAQAIEDASRIMTEKL